MSNSSSLPFTLDNGIATRAALGVVVLAKDETLEPELRQALAGDGVALYHSRIPSDDEINHETLEKMAAELPRALSLLPASRPLDVVAYACTSASTVIGQSNVAAMINAAHPAAHTTDPITAVIAACRHLGVNRLGMLTPYAAPVSAAMRGLLEAERLEIVDFASFEQSRDPVVARISPASVLDAIRELGIGSRSDAVFASCTNLRTLSIIDEAEAAIAKPVISSNAALAWHMRTLAGLETNQHAPGQLLRS